MNELVKSLVDIKTMLSERKYETFNTTDDNGFEGISSSEDFDDLSNDNLAYMAKNGQIFSRTKISFIQRQMKL